MDTHGGIRALLLLSILFIIPFSSKVDSGPSVPLPKQTCSYPNIIGCLICSQDNLMGSFFDTHTFRSDEEVKNFLDREIRNGDLCKGMIENADIFGVSSLHRQLIGEGSHRQLVTKMVFCHHPKFTDFVKEHFCEAIAVEYLPNGLFSDPFELQHLVKREVFLIASVFGDSNLELPSALSNRSVAEIHIDVERDTQKVVVQLPLHSRYPPLDSSGYSNIRIGKPEMFIRCRRRNSESEGCLWALIDLGVAFSATGSNLSWRIPCGNEAHKRTVTIVTFLIALLCSLLIVFSSIIYYSKKKEIKLE